MASLLHIHRLLCLLCLVLKHTTTGTAVEERAADPMVHLTAITGHLSTRVAALQSKTDKLESVLASKQSGLNSLSAKATYNAATVANLTSLLKGDTAQVNQLSAFLNTHLSDLETRVSSLEHPVGFSVQFRDDGVSNTTAESGPVLFDLVTFNTGAGNYSNSTGRYTAPADGTYAFFVSMQRVDPYVNVCLQANLLQNGRVWAECAISACPPGYSSASSMCLMHLRRGSTIHVQSRTNHQIFGSVHSTFSGFKLW